MLLQKNTGTFSPHLTSLDGVDSSCSLMGPPQGSSRDSSALRAAEDTIPIAHRSAVLITSSSDMITNVSGSICGACVVGGVLWEVGYLLARHIATHIEQIRNLKQPRGR